MLVDVGWVLVSTERGRHIQDTAKAIFEETKANNLTWRKFKF
jgi:hypothetical protein